MINGCLTKTEAENFWNSKKKNMRKITAEMIEMEGRERRSHLNIAGVHKEEKSK